MKGPTIRRGARIGGGAILCPGIEIGEKAFVGAGAVVTKDVAPRVVVVGDPRRCCATSRRTSGSGPASRRREEDVAGAAPRASEEHRRAPRRRRRPARLAGAGPPRPCRSVARGFAQRAGERRSTRIRLTTPTAANEQSASPNPTKRSLPSEAVTIAYSRSCIATRPAPAQTPSARAAEAIDR